MALVYLLTNRVNGKRYVGKTKRSLERRWCQHTKDAKSGSDLLLHRAIRKYGSATFFREVLGEYASEEEALAAERLWIEKLQSLGDGGYNLCEGGRGALGYRHSAESREAMSTIAIARGRVPSALCLSRARCPETRSKIVEGIRAFHANNPSRNIGQRRTPETRAQMSLSALRRYALRPSTLKGVPRSPETIAKMREKARAYAAAHPISPEHRARLAEASRARRPETNAKIATSLREHYANNPVTAGTRAKISEANLRHRAENPSAPMPAETRAKIAESVRRHTAENPPSAETIAKRAAGQRRHYAEHGVSDETRAAISEGKRRAYAASGGSKLKGIPRTPEAHKDARSRSSPLRRQTNA